MSGEIADPALLELQRHATMGRLLASVAHEMSAPLGAMLSNRDVELRLLDRIEQAAAGSEPAKVMELAAACRELARIDQLAGERISRLVRSVKIAARAADPVSRRVQLNEIVDSALDLAKTEFRSRIAVETDLESLPEVECQPHLLSQAILNLLTNAGQAIEGTGRITVGTRLEGDSVHIWVADTGRGIPPEDRQKVLKQAFTTKPLGVGTGLGLLIVRQIVTEAHGGSVSFESESGRGTTFHIRIPVRQKSKGDVPSA
ncbi:MAG: ATP-binding protein [Candidatus Solibacter sp.]|nr:ATP-binding protein [Candidatus Solibacter sp.]